ncbi:MAG: hypothetical protein SVR08_13255 [Spirochaetota bacterium]|nr:hypothetical protein [Spirochaetota bacterium]
MPIAINTKEIEVINAVNVVELSAKKGIFNSELFIIMKEILAPIAKDIARKNFQ